MRSLPARAPRAEQWAHQICVEMGKTVESIVQVGRLLLKAKGDLAHGEWGRMFSDGLIPFSPRTAQRYMEIADNPVISNTTHGSFLPASWRTLYELTKVPEPTLKRALSDGVITPDMERKAVSALMSTPKPTQVSDSVDHFIESESDSADGDDNPQTWADPLDPSPVRVSDVSEKEADSAMALRQIKRLYKSLTRKHRAALKEWINERS